jgi:hypothetical protein
MDRQTAQIIMWLREQYAPDVILLGGSRAAGSARETSDWDLFLIGGSAAERHRRAVQWQAAHLDIEHIPWPAISDGVLRIFDGPVAALRVLLANDRDQGAAIVSATAVAYAVGPPAEDVTQAHELRRLLTKIDAYQHEPLVAYLHITGFVQALLPCWFARRRRWSEPAQRAIPAIRAQDPLFALMLTTIALSPEMDERAAACHAAYAYLFP